MARKRKGRPVNGWVVLDKPAGLTSTQALSKVRRLFNAAKAGHAGTLDPLATGILPIAFGEATKTVSFAMDRVKAYRFTLRWGEERSTDDGEGEVVATSAHRPDRAAIEAVLPGFIGDVEQVPPAFSAIKVNGERAYDLARDGETVELASRFVYIDSVSLIAQPDPDHAVFEAVCGKGTYMRSLARDVARALGTVGHISARRRLQVAPFSLDDAFTLDHLEQRLEEGTLDEALLPVETPLDDIPAVALNDEEAHRIRCGQAISLLRRSDRERLAALNVDPEEEDPLVLAFHGRALLAIARLVGAELQPMRVLNLD